MEQQDKKAQDPSFENSGSGNGVPPQSAIHGLLVSEFRAKWQAFGIRGGTLQRVFEVLQKPVTRSLTNGP
jgi:hypothetical protein